jgi:hypothetical protein
VFKKTWTSEFKNKEKCARSYDSLPTGLLCNQYNPECDSKSAIRIQAKFRGHLKQNTIVNLMKKILLGLSAVVAVFLPLSQNAQAHWVVYHHVYWHHHYWHHGYWYGGVWHPGYWF